MEFLIILILLLLIPPFSIVYSQEEDCSISFCFSHSFPIRFPFQLNQQPQQKCFYPSGFNLNCTNQGKLLLNLPFSGDFFVRDINYLTQEIQLYDPQNCLPNRILNLNLNLSSSPFVASYVENYTFLRCSSEFVRSRFTPIDCLSNSTISVLATSSVNRVQAMKNVCTIIETVPIPRVHPMRFGDGFSSDFNGDLFLSWNFPNCKICEAQGGTCEMNSSQDVICSDVSAPGKGRHHGILKLIGYTIFLPFVILPSLFIGILCCKFIVVREQNRINANLLRLSNTRAAAAEEMIPQLARALDESIIQSYSKVIVDENRNLIVDLICSICLAEYQFGDILRCIPECEHYFHADCIDEWLRIKSTCPVCRIAPPRHAQNT